MMEILRQPKWSVALRWLIGLLLVWAALGKLADLQEFYTALLAYRLPLPGGAIRMTAIVLPWLELLCGLLLIANYRTSAALGWALVLFLVFAVCTGQAWLRGLSIACGCLDLQLLGIAPESGTSKFLESTGFAFVRAGALAAAAFMLMRRTAGLAR
jgi:uncharacterized membrane protein YphA (DoxX/SURF4 family)